MLEKAEMVSLQIICKWVVRVARKFASYCTSIRMSWGKVVRNVTLKVEVDRVTVHEVTKGLLRNLDSKSKSEEGVLTTDRIRMQTMSYFRNEFT